MIDSVILDLDHTLIYSPDDVRKLPKNSFHLKSHRVFLGGSIYVILERPFLREFLQGLGNKKIAIWTAATSDYAQFIMHHIIIPYLSPQQKIEFLWHKTHCAESMAKFGLLKHLELLNLKRSTIDPSTAIIIDDNRGIRSQPYMVCTIAPFDAKNLDDVQLLNCLNFIQNYEK